MAEELKEQMSLNITAARALTTTAKSAPQMQGISSRWLLRMLPWVQLPGGTYRVNRRLSYSPHEGILSFTSDGILVRVVPTDLAKLPWMQGFDDSDVLNSLADRFVQQE